MKEVQLKYGRENIPISIPARMQVFEFQEPVVDIEETLFTAKLKAVLTERNISGSAAIIVADKTRLCGYEQILPWVVDTLIEKGIKKKQITFYIAYGTHSRQTDEECRNSYGEVYDSYPFVHHDCSESSDFVALGTTSRGTSAEIRRDVAESELILTIGAVSHHYFAGYGGGRKLLFPGVGGKNGIYANHGLFLDKEKQGLAIGCWPGNLEGNPLAADLKEVHDLLPEYLSIHAILDSFGEPASYHFGKNYEDFLLVCRKLDDSYRVEIEKQFDLVVAASGGYPKDINMIQAHKSIHNAANLVNDGGTLLMFAECIDGIGSKTFLPYFRMGGWKQTFQALLENYAGNGGTALAMMEKTKRINIYIITSLSEELCSEIGLKKITVADAEQILENHSGTLGLAVNSSLLVANRM